MTDFEDLDPSSGGTRGPSRGRWARWAVAGSAVGLLAGTALHFATNPAEGVTAASPEPSLSAATSPTPEATPNATPAPTLLSGVTWNTGGPPVGNRGPYYPSAIPATPEIIESATDLWALQLVTYEPSWEGTNLGLSAVIYLVDPAGTRYDVMSIDGWPGTGASLVEFDADRGIAVIRASIDWNQPYAVALDLKEGTWAMATSDEWPNAAFIGIPSDGVARWVLYSDTEGRLATWSGAGGWAVGDSLVGFNFSPWIGFSSETDRVILPSEDGVATHYVSTDVVTGEIVDIEVPAGREWCGVAWHDEETLVSDCSSEGGSDIFTASAPDFTFVETDPESYYDYAPQREDYEGYQFPGTPLVYRAVVEGSNEKGLGVLTTEGYRELLTLPDSQWDEPGFPALSRCSVSEKRPGVYLLTDYSWGANLVVDVVTGEYFVYPVVALGDDDNSNGATHISQIVYIDPEG